MGTRQKITLILSGLFLTFLILMVIIVSLNFRDFGIKSAEKRALLTAEVVKGGLTAHMVNGMMDKRGYFLDQIENIENISALWIARSPTVIKQYGEGFNSEIARDEIDKKVLKSGKIEEVMTETATKSTMRMTIPFTATAFGATNCLTCHSAKEGEVLGAISMVIDVSDVRGSSFITVGYIAAFAIIFMILVLIIVNKFFKPYINIFYSIKDVMKAAYHGNYSKRVDGGSLTESNAVANMLNSLLEKLQKVFEEIDKKVYIFVQNKNKEISNDPLININKTIDQLSEIYKFKQTIEHDEELDDIYERLAYVFKTKFSLEDFSIIEADTHSGIKKVVYSVNGCHCDVEAGKCRADRINMMVDSTIFDNTCPVFNKPDLQYLCIPYSISNELNLIISIVTKDEQESLRVRSIVGLIEDYIATAQPAIVSKKLMQILNKMARVDQLTGMFNRKYLDEFVETAIPQALRTNTPYGILMIDIDFFKMINDTYGHDVGDEGIRIVSRVIKESIRSSDIAIRFGGEEFIVLLYNCDKNFVKEVAEKIRINFAKQKISAGAESFSKTLSVGAVMFPDDSDSIWKCIKYADMSLYYAKEHGRNQVVCFDKSIIKDDSMQDSF
ncbi:MAG: GGDEF domain-containing protein [Sulfurimonas sp.]|uniref:GGDEF domain-containing protein n=1 Tax=Sulfurimonas sp. TaxID=2022749 RepID=UPI002612BA8A|nr:GGDEF domain-containing protein [Sulfurimonas sp.]MCW8894703.1 GGDEF domain-containing protein [Sulfurimonas sp.]MCW8955110.1 GGDEF domain-containing protein [Sulfurimonas sp.]MCW9067123.1 GGDEF domain-containing protein [Sulfurimonas sp.]